MIPKAARKIAIGASALALGGVAAFALTSSSTTAQQASDKDTFCSKFVPNLEASDTYKRFSRTAPLDRDKWIAMRTSICADQSTVIPQMNTLFGQALAAAGEMALPETEPVPTTTQPTTTTTTTTEPPPSTTAFPGLSPDGIAMSISAGSGPSTADWDASRVIGMKVVRSDTLNDAYFLNAAQRGMQVLPLVYGQGDTFHAGSITKATTIAQRYCRGGTFWQEHPEFSQTLAPVWIEIGNEPYLSHEGMWPTVATWAQGWLATAKEVERLSSCETILPVGADINGPQGWRPFTDYVLDAAPEIAQVMDAWSVHPYCAGKDPTVYTSFGGGSSDFQRYNYISDKLEARGVNKPWMITEFGYHTDSLNQGVTEAQQADYVAKAYDIVKAENPKPLLFNWYHIRDFGDGSSQEHNFGIHFRRNGTIKPASAVIQNKAT